MSDDRVALIKQIREANDIVDVIGAYVALRPAGATFKGLCPFHDDHTPSFDVDPRRQRYRCWACGKHGDVLQFIQEHERVDFREALELLARRAGISLEKSAGFRQNPNRAAMLELTRWSAEQYQQCLLESPIAEPARRYLGERRFTGDTVRRFGLGYAPADGNWLAQRALRAGHSAELLEKLGLITRRTEGDGYYDRFRDRVMFPIRDARGQTVGFGGRILPTNPQATKLAKYYNSTETPLFTKSEHLYGLDQARQAGTSAGYLAVVEGYTDVLMAHQMGVQQVVATLGTALNARHVRHLRRFVPRVVLVFDADEGGEAGVDRALEIFVSHDVELAVVTLPAGMDPFDMLVQQGPEAFRQALDNAVDALEFKLNRVLAVKDEQGTPASVESQRRGLDALLRIIALAPADTGQASAVKHELMVTRIARRLSLREETVWERLQELRATAKAPAAPNPAAEPKTAAPAPKLEKELLQVLLAEPELVPVAAAAVAPEQLEHPGLRRLLREMYALHAEGLVADFDRLRERVDRPKLIEKALQFQEVGRANPDRAAWIEQILAEFQHRRIAREKQQLHTQLQSANDHTEAVDLLRRLQQQSGSGF